MVFDDDLKEFEDEVDKRSSAQAITGEAHTIPSTAPFTVKLDEIPDETREVDISGSVAYTEQDTTPQSSGQYMVDYDTGVVTFHSSNAADAITAAYDGLGSRCDADDMNRRSAEIELVEVVLGVGVRGKAVNVSDRLIKSAVGMGFTYAAATPNKTLKINPAVIFTGPAAWYDFEGYSIDFGSGGSHQIAISNTNYQRVIFTYEPNKRRVNMHKGNVAATAEEAAWPRIFTYSEEVPLSGVLLQGDGSSAAGGVKEITQGEIKDIRPVIQGANQPKEFVQGGSGAFYRESSKVVTLSKAFVNVQSVVISFATQPRPADGALPLEAVPALWVDSAYISGTSFIAYSSYATTYANFAWAAVGTDH